MQINTRHYLRYIHQSLADATRLTPSLEKADSITEVTGDEIRHGRINEHNRKKLLAQARQSGRKRADDKESEDLLPINVVVMPVVYGLLPEHGQTGARRPKKIAPLLLFAKLETDGSLRPEETPERQMVLARDLLEPNRLDVSIGNMDDADAAYAAQKVRGGNWPDVLRQGMEILEKVSGQSYESLLIDGYLRLGYGYILIADNRSAAQSILRLVDLLRARESPQSPLLDALLTQAPDRPLLNAAQQLEVSLQHLGQMECAYGLSISQREALAHYLSGHAGHDILAVDGPPGTGKTTLLLSVVATLWVKHALDKAEPPVIVATSTNNQSVTNILRAFAEVKETDGPSSGRWLPGLQSYGLYLPAQSRGKDTFEFPVHIMQGMGKDAIFDAQTYEDKVGLNAAREAFLENFKRAFQSGDMTLSEAMECLHSRLRNEVATISRAVGALKTLSILLGEQDVSDVLIDDYSASLQDSYTQCLHEAMKKESALHAALQRHADWESHVHAEPWWSRFMALIGLKRTHHQRNRVFCAQSALNQLTCLDETFFNLQRHTEIEQAIQRCVHQCRAALAQEKRRLLDIESDIKKLQESINVLQPLLMGSAISTESVQQTLDTGPRHTAFKLATHYWEARYLVQLQEQFSRHDAIHDSKSPKCLLAQYRRLAKLHPCFVCTLYTLPNKFIAWRNRDECCVLYGAIDLLIVDEAGQVPPEIGAPGFIFAKRALVVGDVDQIEPIWMVPARIDHANLMHSGLATTENILEKLQKSGAMASCGSLMRMAQRATPYAKYPERGRGMFLSEHRRCWPEIIRMCNVLVYGERLKPCRKDDGQRKIMPSVGYVHIPGHSHTRGGSRDNPTEAAAIAQWIARRKTDIMAAYDHAPLSELVAIITPFAAQSQRVRKALNDVLGKTHGITVGTIHALQGAQRRLVIFSPAYGLGTEPGHTFIDRSPSMLNVAISRAQDAFLVFGNMHLFRSQGKHPCAIIGQMLFNGGSNEISGLDPVLLVPGFDMGPGRLINTLQAHRDVLQDALQTAQRHVVIVSPFLGETAMIADNIAQSIRSTVARGVQVRVVSDPELNKNSTENFDRCIQYLQKSGAQIYRATTQGVHSKLLLVDRSWLVVGSFNWLSALRSPSHQWARYESSLRYDGNEAFEMISKSLQDLADVIGGPKTVH